MSSLTARQTTAWAVVGAMLGVAAPLAAQAPAPTAPVRAQFDSAYFAWDRGDYPTALRYAERVLTAPGGEALLERVALLTGELYHVHEVAPDGRSPQWTSDGRHAAYEVGAGADTRIRIVAVGAQGARQAAEVAGRGAAFAPDGRRIALLRVPESPQLAAARQVEQRALDAMDVARLRQARAEIAGLEAATARVVVRELGSGREQERAVPGIDRLALAYAGDGTLVLVGRRTGQTDRTDLFALPERGAPQPLTDGPGIKGATLLAAGAERLIYTVDRDRIVVQELRGGALLPVGL